MQQIQDREAAGTFIGSSPENELLVFSVVYEGTLDYEQRLVLMFSS